MDYAEAAERLAKPVSKTSKILGHKLHLSEMDTGERDQPKAYALRYFDTNILNWYPDGGVIVADGGFLSSAYTIEKVNEYLPKDWKLTTVPVRFEAKKFVGVLYRASYDAEWSRQIRWAYPYKSKVKFYETGRADMELVQQHSAFDLIRKVGDYADRFTGEFTTGHVPFECIDHLMRDRIMNAWDNDDNAKEKYAMQAVLLSGEIHPATMLGAVIYGAHTKISTRHISDAYWSENYPFTGTAKTKSIKQQVLELEYRMKTEDQMPKRYKGNSKVFYVFRDAIRAALEKFLLEGLGFTIYEKESFAHLRKGNHAF
jgi:hypothetical protein